MPLHFCTQQIFTLGRAMCEGAAVMVSEKWISAVLLLQLCYTGCGFCDKILVWPCDMSHWLNLNVILEELSERGHEVTVLVSPQNFIIDHKKPSTLNFEMFSVSHNREDAEKSLNEFLNLSVNIMPSLSPWTAAIKLQEYFLNINGILKRQCESVIYNQSLMKKLQDANYSVMIIDPMIPCGELIAELLSVPFVNTLRLSLGNNLEKYCGKLPFPPSYVPTAMTGLTDKMNFLERVKNLMLSLFFDFWLLQFDSQLWDQFYSEVLGKRLCFSFYSNYQKLRNNFLKLSLPNKMLQVI